MFQYGEWPEDRVFQIAHEFLREYKRQLGHPTQRLQPFKMDEPRGKLARAWPEAARMYEGRTLEEKEAGLKDLAMSVAVAHAIFFALDHFYRPQ